jgi:Asp-tRNA(Asn)/Glu-tRNA(Gln) amidotransferase B subunit
MLETGADPSHIMEEQQLGQVSDEGALAEIVTQVIQNHPDEVARYKAGENKLIKFFLGMVMKVSEGTADPALAKNILLVELND